VHGYGRSAHVSRCRAPQITFGSSLLLPMGADTFATWAPQWANMDNFIELPFTSPVS